MAKSDKIAEIVKALKTKGALTPCPACGHPTFTLIDGYFTQEYPAIEQRFPFFLTPRNRGYLTYIVLACDNCGYLRQHTTKALEKKDLLNSKK
jgi:uncharacterized Zn finger protein